MTSFRVKVPFTGDAISVFKTVSDTFNYHDFQSVNLTQVDDDTTSFLSTVTLGMFRLSLAGQCITADRDFDSQIALFKISSKDRTGKGKIEANVKLFIQEMQNQSVVCECDILTKGMLTRVNLPIENVFSSKISAVLTHIIEKENVSLDTIANEPEPHSQVSSIKKPYWVIVLQFPTKLISVPTNWIRHLAIR